MAKTKAEKAELNERRNRCCTDKQYLSEQLGYDFQPDTHKDLFANYLQIDPAKTLQSQSDIKNRMVLWSRGTYKTTSIVVEIVQLILNFPDIRILIMQDTVKNAMLLLDEVRKHFDGLHFKSKLPDIFPEFCQTEKKLGTAYKFTVPARTATRKESTVTVASPRSTKTGMHFEVGFFDDLVTAENYASSDQLRKTITDFSLYVPLIDPGGYRYVTGTRYTFGDLYEHILRQNVESKSWQISIRACWTIKDGVKTLLFPQVTLPDGRLVGHTIEMLEKMQVEDPQMFAAQYLNQPIASDTQLFPDVLILSHVRSTLEVGFPSLGFKTLFVDLATGGTNDDSVVLCGQQDCLGKMYVTDGVGSQWNVPNFALVVIDQALKHKPVKILLEKSAAGVVFAEYVKVVAMQRGLTLPLDFIKVDNQKNAKFIRISTVNGALKQGKLWFLAGLPCWNNMLEQFTTFPRNRHDDYPDTVSLMTGYYAVNGTSIPVVRSIGQYLIQQPAVPEFVRDTDHDCNSGGMGSDF